MAKTSMKIKQQRPAKFSAEYKTAAESAGRPHAYFENTASAEFASVN